MKKMPPVEKTYEAYSALADGRVEMHEGYAFVDSSEGAKTYEVAWKGDTYSSTDNATYWQGYAGYPVIAVLVLQGRLPGLDEECLAEMADIPWKRLNDAHKRDYARAVDEALAGKAHEREIRAAAEVLHQALGELDLTLKRGTYKHVRDAADVQPATEVGEAPRAAEGEGKARLTRKFISWNIDSLNAALTGTSLRSELSRAVLATIAAEDADVIALQETKLPVKGMSKKQAEALAAYFPDYNCVWVSSHEPARKGYAGTMALFKKGMSVEAAFPSIGAPEPMDDEGRMITLDLGDLYFNLVYTPNAGDGLRRLAEREEWDARYADYLAELDATKPVVSCGDYNVAHEEIDLANPASNHFSAGFTDEERAGFSNLLGRGFTDTFRHLHGNVEGAYSWWAQRVRTSKINNSGWRIDYFLVSDRIADRVIRSEMLDSGARQDHAPIVLELA
jgi:exodeoxyribonuclease-3